MSITREGGDSGFLEAAIHRLDRAMARLDVRMNALLSEVESHNGGLFDQDRAKLAEELDAARGRERALQAAGAQASEALGLAIAEIQTVLGDGGGEDDVDDDETEEA